MAGETYVHSLGEALHYELKPVGVNVTVLAAGLRPGREQSAS